MRQLLRLPTEDGTEFYLLGDLPILPGARVMLDSDGETANLVIVGEHGGHQVAMSPKALSMLSMDALNLCGRIEAIAMRRAREVITRSAGRYSIGDAYLQDADRLDRNALDYGIEGRGDQCDLLRVAAQGLRSVALALDAVEAMNRAEGESML